MTLVKMDALTLTLDTVKFQLSNWPRETVNFNVEVWENTLTVSFDVDSDFAFFDLRVNAVFSNWKFNQDTLTMSVEL